MSTASPTTSGEPTTNWGRLALISLCGGMGLALMLTLICAAIVWFNGRSGSPRPWDTTAIVALPAPRFVPASDEEKGVQLTYTLENRTELDYRSDYDGRVTILLRMRSGALSEPIPGDAVFIRKPIFLPSKQQAYVTLSLLLPGMPERKASDPDEQYQNSLRGFLLDHFRNVDSFAVFDSANRYQINLPLGSAKDWRKAEFLGRGNPTGDARPGAPSFASFAKAG